MLSDLSWKSRKINTLWGYARREVVMVRAGKGKGPRNGVINAWSGDLGTAQTDRRSLDRRNRGILGFLEFSRLIPRGTRLSLMCEMENGLARA